MDFYFQHGLADSTQRSYYSAKRRYISFCAEHNLVALPVSEPQLCKFISYLAIQKLSHSTIKCYLSAVRHLQVEGGWGDPRINEMAKLEQVLKGIKRLQAVEKGSPKQKLPITPNLLIRIKQIWEKDPVSWDVAMLWAAVCLCFFGFFRSGQITQLTEGGYDQGTHLSPEDVSVDSLTNPQMLKIRLKCSKTDPFRVGIDVFVGRTDGPLCPVAAMLGYLSYRRSSPGLLFKFKDGRPLTRSSFVKAVRSALDAAGIDSSRYSGHSFRSGAATTAAKQGIGDATIMMLGRWRSSAYQRYVKTPRRQLAAFSQVLAGEQLS